MNININDLNFDNIAQWPTVVKAAMVGLVILLVTGLGYWLFIGPNMANFDKLVLDEKNLRIEFEEKQLKASSLGLYQKQFKEMQDRFGNILKTLPSENEMPSLLEDISKTGVATGLKFQLFAPQAQITHDFYMELPINIKVTGSYDQLALFLSRIAEMNRIVTLHDFTIEWAAADGGTSTTLTNNTKQAVNTLVMEITAKIYWYRAK